LSGKRYGRFQEAGNTTFMGEIVDLERYRRRRKRRTGDRRAESERAPRQEPPPAATGHEKVDSAKPDNPGHSERNDQTAD